MNITPVHRRHIALIGMPSAGKTKVGKLLAQHLGWKFVDTDDRIVEQCRETKLQHIVDRLTPQEFAKLEEETCITTVGFLTKPTVIATSGSMVYLEKAMDYLQRRAHIIYLETSLETVGRRVAKHPDRGIVFAPGETLADLYRRRVPLYEQWAHRTVDTNHGRSQVAKDLAKQLRKEGVI